MVEDIKRIIADASRALFYAGGYQKVTMRQIAERCGISVGNLTYHYPRKEDLLMLEHDRILNTFLNSVLSSRPDLSGLAGYITVESSFLYRILKDPPVAALYADVINVPGLRSRYCRAHHRLYLQFCEPAADSESEWAATVAMCALEYEFADEGLLDDFACHMENIFRTRILFQGEDPGRYNTVIHTAVESGMALARQLCPSEQT